MENFVGIDLNDSFVLGWELQESTLEFSLEASIWPDSKYYSKPKPEEYTCYKSAKLRFTSIKNIDGLISQKQARFSRDKNNEKDYGNIDVLQKTINGFLIEGDFGKVIINSGKMEFSIET